MAKSAPPMPAPDKGKGGFAPGKKGVNPFAPKKGK